MVVAEPLHDLVANIEFKETTVSNEDRAHFTERLADGQTRFDDDFTWWVMEREVSMARSFGSPPVIPMLLSLLSPQKRDQSSMDAEKDALEAIAGISGWDVRLDENGGERLWRTSREARYLSRVNRTPLTGPIRSPTVGAPVSWQRRCVEVGAEALDVIGPVEDAGVDHGGRDLDVGCAGGWGQVGRCLTVEVQPPALHRAGAVQHAGMPAAGADLAEAARRNAHALHVVCRAAPAVDLPAGVEGAGKGSLAAGAPAADAEMLERAWGDVRQLVMRVGTPALDRAGARQRAGEVTAGADLLVGRGRRWVRLVEVVGAPAVQLAWFQAARSPLSEPSTTR